jgi:hypothetical protein
MLRQTVPFASPSSDSPLPIAEVERVWPLISDAITGALKKAKTPWRAHQVFDWLLTGHCQLWLFDQGELVVVSFIDDRGCERVVKVFVVAGDASDAMLERAEVAMAVMGRQMGCSAIEAEGRLGWERRLSRRGWSRQWVMMRKGL